jgi:hypothetical protein
VDHQVAVDIFAALKASDFRRCAKALIAQHGGNAAYRARRRAINLLSQDDRDGYEIWIKVAKTIREIEMSGIAMSLLETLKSAATVRRRSARRRRAMRGFASRTAPRPNRSVRCGPN